MTTNDLADVELDALLRVARAHRDHERHAMSEAVRQASDLRRWSDALAALGRHWLEAEPDVDLGQEDPLGPMFLAAGSTDLNTPVAVAAAGILFMEGGEEPYELRPLRDDLTRLVERCEHEVAWAGGMMEVGWDRETPLLRSSALVQAGYHRCLTLMRTTLHAGTMSVVGNLLRAASTALDSVPFDDAPRLRSQLPEAGAQVLIAAWLIDQAIALRVDAAGGLARSDPDWTRYIDALTRYRRIDQQEQTAT